MVLNPMLVEKVVVVVVVVPRLPRVLLTLRWATVSFLVVRTWILAALLSATILVARLVSILGRAVQAWWW